MIDVLAFPPTLAELTALREEAGRPEQGLVHRARWARFVAVGLFACWLADMAAVFAPTRVGAPVLFGSGAVVLALAVLAAHVFSIRTMARAASVRREVDRDFAAVGSAEGLALAERAHRDPVAGQYLRMVGRQKRPLCRAELAALDRWLAAAAAGDRTGTS